MYPIYKKDFFHDFLHKYKKADENKGIKTQKHKPKGLIQRAKGLSLSSEK